MAFGLRTGCTTEEDVRWFERMLKQPATIDSVVLVPPLAKAANAVVAGYGFPVRFKLEIFDGQDTPRIVLDQTVADFPNPSCTPIIARFDPQKVKRARFTATEPWSVDGPEILAMADASLARQSQPRPRRDCEQLQLTLTLPEAPRAMKGASSPCRPLRRQCPGSA